MEELINNVKQNYRKLTFSLIDKIKEKTINDIFFIDNKYVLKIYNVDDEKQILNSVETQKRVHDSLGIAPEIILNNNGNIVTKYNDRIYCIQEFISGKQERFDLIEKVAKELSLMHETFRNIKNDKYKFEEKNKTYIDIENDINCNLEKIKKSKLDAEITPIVNELIKKRMELLKEFKCEYKPKIYQIIHGDVRKTNIICKNNVAYFIDFDFTSCGDLLFEIGSAAMLISDFDICEAKRFLAIYNECSKQAKYNENEVFGNLLSYYAQSSFPLKLIGKIENKAFQKMSQGRISSLEFCKRVLESE